MIKCKREINGNVWNLNVILQNTNYTKSSLSQSEAPKHTAQLYLAYFLAINKAHNKNTIRDGGSIAPYTAYAVYAVKAVFTVYLIQTALHCLNRSMYAYIYC